MNIIPGKDHWYWMRSNQVRYQGKKMSPQRAMWAALGRPSVGRTTMILTSCGEKTCVKPEHLEARPRKGAFRKHFICKSCNRPLRPEAWKADDPESEGTVAHHGSGLCMTCHQRIANAKKLDARLALSEEEQNVVRRVVPEDLWTLFGVK